MPRINIVREMYTKMKMKKRIEANRIIGTIVFRDHYSSHPNRHSWDLCGHPVYWWAMKAASETKYLEKIFLWTEVKQAWKDAKEMSDKFVIIKRSLEECKEPMWKFVDDLKGSKSRVNISGWPSDEEIREALGFEPTVAVSFPANEPLIRAESYTRMIERYFEDDIAEKAVIATKILLPSLHMKHPDYPEYLLRVCQSGQSGFTTRQERLESYSVHGPTIQPYLGRIHSMSNRIVYVEVGEDERLDLHNEEDLELAKFKMRKRLERKKNGGK